MDEGHKLTDKKLEKLIRKLDKVYSQAAKETEAKLNDYMRRFKIKDDIKLQQVKSGELDYQEWVDWRIGQIMVGKRWEEMRDTLAEDLTHVDEIATQMVGESMHDVYALNHNFGTFEAEKGSLVDTSYTLYDKHTVENLIKKNPDLLKAPSLDKNKDLRWNKQNFQSAITQSILQGEDIRKTAKRVALGTTKKDRNAAIRNARTATTNAENAGRCDSYERAEKMGIKLKQVWLAALDGRTRDSHRRLDGEKISVGEKFSNGLRFPGDPQGAAHEVWNCRCTLIAEVEGVDYNLTDISERNNYKLGGQSYDEWKKGHEKTLPVSIPPATPVRRFQAIRGSLGDDFVDGMETVLNFTEEEDVRDLFYKYAEDLKVIDTNLRGGAFFRSSDGGIHINASKISKGDDLHLPYQTIFHEFGHNIDWLANGRNSSNFISNSYYNGKLIDTVKQDWEHFKAELLIKKHKEIFVLSESGVRADDLVFSSTYLRTRVREVLPPDSPLKSLIRQHRKGGISDEELLNGIGHEHLKELVKQNMSDQDAVDFLKSEAMPISESGSISDIIEGCTHISYPLGVGHGEAYHNSSSTAREFFAEVIDGKAANPKSLAQMRRVFPNAVKVVEKMIRSAIT